ncbi:DNA polymerase III, beta subunit [Desulfarculus baarsii DSM 2075]|uniref:Beta sliding clamp n=1 Tax=Desulfarculus baarsii (strain ATCC 33931 / DSM 2075 / LMG 7858 / VKM B-1802 / 2st14) TaxID=644282 RepID=E1QGB1_DESB2|nr:DNA polymerase III subunit beta [Desulfarculus baarsii]ADK83623.1 DNA polymerase III, beta subunit [Desulfarculus baarsii DSM 2075]
MELTARKEDLARNLQKSQSVVEKRTSMPILSNVLLEAADGGLTVTATDLEISFQGSLEAKVNKPGRVTVPARKFYEIIKELPSDDVYLKEKENQHIHLTGGRASYDLVGLSAADYPALPDIADLSCLEVDGDVLGEMIEKTIFSISQEDTRFNLAGLFVQKRRRDDREILRMVSTDGHRLSLIDREIPGLAALDIAGGVIIPRKGVAEMRRLAEDGGLSLGLNASFAVVKKDGATLILRMQEGSFPDYEVVVPKNAGRVALVNRQAFGEVIRRVSILATDRFQGVQLSFKEGLLELISQNPDLGEARETIEVDYEGESFTVGFNARYFLDLCGAMRSEVISLAFVDENNPCLIKGEGDEGFLSVIMPMRL